MRVRITRALPLLLIALLPFRVLADAPATPESFLGFRVGADRKHQ